MKLIPVTVVAEINPYQFHRSLLLSDGLFIMICSVVQKTQTIEP